MDIERNKLIFKNKLFNIIFSDYPFLRFASEYNMINQSYHLVKRLISNNTSK